MTAHEFKGKVALVTGGTSGIGKAAVMAFAEREAQVVIVGRSASRGEETVRMVQEIGGSGIFVSADVSKPADVQRMMEHVIRRFRRLDYAFNNAGGFSLVGGEFCNTADVTDEIWDRVVDVNLKGVWLCMKYELLQMLITGGGAIVNASSIDGLRGSVEKAPYVVSKHGVIGLTRTAAKEYATRKIRINAVCPGCIRTPAVDQAMRKKPGRNTWFLEHIPMGRMGTPEEVAKVVVWLCSDEASYVTGHALVTDGGFLA